MCLGLDAILSGFITMQRGDVMFFQNPSPPKVIFAWSSPPPPPISSRLCHLSRSWILLAHSRVLMSFAIAFLCNDWNVFEQL